jgi:hypothetical protein
VPKKEIIRGKATRLGMKKVYKKNMEAPQKHGGD